ncbi:MAG: phage tail protein [Rhodobacteraceae bacterium]|nr:phage tail protein [Paracoccaceae bacterium]
MGTYLDNFKAYKQPGRDLYRPELSHRFLATFFIETGVRVGKLRVKLPSPIDVRFARIDGLSREVSMNSYHEGGKNTGSHHFPEQVTHSPLTFERGVMTVTPLSLVFNHMLTEFKVLDIDIVIMLLNESDIPISSWLASGATATSWKTGQLDAQSNTVLMNSLTFNYRKLRCLGVKV